mgnify:CR=1 FL=1
MRLLLIPDPTSPNGEDAFCREIARRAPQRGHETTVQAIPNGPLAATLDQLSATGFALACDFVVINSLQPAALLAAKAAGKKAAVRLVDSYANASPTALEEVKLLALKADLVLVPSRHLGDIVKAWGANGQVRHVPYAYDLVMAQQIALVTVRASRASFHVVSCCPLDESTRPGTETLLAALARLRLDWHLSLIGEGPALGALQQRVAQLLCADRVSFLPPMPHHKLMEFFRAAKAYVDPCGVDGFPSLALYALSEGCPVIGARHGALRELIRDGENGLLFNLGDARALSEAVVTLSSVRGMSLNLIAEGIKTVGSHSWDNTVDATLTAIEGLMRTS